MAPSYSNGRNVPRDDTSLLDDFRALVAYTGRVIWSTVRIHGRRLAMASVYDSAWQLRRNLQPRRLFSFPHLVVSVWVIVLLWGERWVYHNRVESCAWDTWEQWPAGARPHHLIFVADPQLIDPHSYPGRPWPINPLTIMVTDNYMRRSYNQLQRLLHPDTIFFLGDLFDGGREWKTAHGGDFNDPQWGHRPEGEKKWARLWRKKYGEDFWLSEYERFGDIFFKPWNDAGLHAGPGQRGRRLITSLPGNHDLGFGDEVRLDVRNRFECYFGEGNRVDVIGNHTFVSIDAVSMSADTSELRANEAIQNIFRPTEDFLHDVAHIKKKAVARELRYLSGDVEEVPFPHRIEEAAKADFSDKPHVTGADDQADFPTILLSHVPLYRPEGTPCGPNREHWPPAKPPKGQTDPVFPDHPNAISVSGGYQYQNVLSEEDSHKVVDKIGNVIHAFSGDDHDYCELVHDSRLNSVREITVKAFSMAMGVPTPGFLMASLYNPVDELGNPLNKPAADGSGSGPTIQTHLCLLPPPYATYVRYVFLGIFTLVVLSARAALVPVLRLAPFAMDAEGQGQGHALLPTHFSMGGNRGKEKAEDHDQHHVSGGTSAGYSASRSSAAGAMHSRDRSFSNAPGGGMVGDKNRHHRQGSIGYGHSKQKSSSANKLGGRWGWGGGEGGPRIQILSDPDDELYDSGKGKWKAAGRRVQGGRFSLGIIGREIWTSVWRVLWMAGVFWAWLNWRG